MEFSAPDFTIAKALYTALGAALLWAKNRSSDGKTYGFSYLFRFVRPPLLRDIAELIVFSSVGTVVAIVLINPANAAQALTGGLAWTGMLAIPDRTGNPDENG